MELVNRNKIGKYLNFIHILRLLASWNCDVMARFTEETRIEWRKWIEQNFPQQWKSIDKIKQNRTFEQYATWKRLAKWQYVFQNNIKQTTSVQQQWTTQSSQTNIFPQHTSKVYNFSFACFICPYLSIVSILSWSQVISKSNTLYLQTILKATNSNNVIDINLVPRWGWRTGWIFYCILASNL